MNQTEVKGICVIKHICKKIKNQKLCVSFLFCNPGLEAGNVFLSFKKWDFQINCSEAWNCACFIHSLFWGGIILNEENCLKILVFHRNVMPAYSPFCFVSLVVTLILTEIMVILLRLWEKSLKEDYSTIETNPKIHFLSVTQMRNKYLWFLHTA